MITQSFDLNLIPDSSPVVVHCDQYDRGTGRLVISLYNGNVSYTPTGTAKIQGRKPDGKGFEYSATFSGNVVTANLTEQMTAVAGRVQTQIVVTETTGRTGTFVFILDVQRSALPANTDMSESEYQIVEELLDEVEEIRPELQGYVDAAEDFSEDAEAWAEGKRGGVPVSPSDPTYQHNSKYWSDVASQYAQGGLIYKGSCTFANIPTTGMIAGDMWNIEDAFTTDSRFQEGAGVSVAAGTNIAWNPNSKWDVLATGGGVSGDYVGLYGMTEIQSSDGQGTTLLDLNQYTSVGNYFCNGKAKISTSYYAEIGLNTTSTGTHSNAQFLLYVRKINDAWLMQDLYLVHATNVRRTIHYQRCASYTTFWDFGLWRADVDTGSVSPDLSPYSLGNGMNNVLVNNIVDGDVLKRVNGKWSNVPINKVTSLAVDLTGWTSDTTSQSGTTLYKKQISLNHVYVENPTVDIGSSGVLPTKAEQESYNLLQYATVDDTVPCLYLYASAIPTTAFYIKVKGVD